MERRRRAQLQRVGAHFWAVTLVTLSMPLACGDGEGDSDSTGGASGSGGSTSKGGASGSGGSTSKGGSGGKASGASGADSSGGEPSGSSGADGGGGEPSTPGEGGAPALPECSEDVMPISDCEVVGDVCARADGCCRCIDFPSAPSCGSLWDCNRLDLNTEDCPATPPTPGEPCAMLDLDCSYCLSDGPQGFHCGRIEVGSDEAEWNEGGGLQCNE